MFQQKDENLFKYTENEHKKGISSTICKIFTSITRGRKRKSTKFFKVHILRWTGFRGMPLTTLCDDYIDRPILTEKNTF